MEALGWAGAIGLARRARRFDAEAKSGASGARLSVTRVSGSDNNDTGNGLGLTLSGHSERYGAYQLFTIREASLGILEGVLQPARPHADKR